MVLSLTGVAHITPASVPGLCRRQAARLHQMVCARQPAGRSQPPTPSAAQKAFPRAGDPYVNSAQHEASAQQMTFVRHATTRQSCDTVGSLPPCCAKLTTGLRSQHSSFACVLVSTHRQGRQIRINPERQAGYIHFIHFIRNNKNRACNERVKEWKQRRAFSVFF